MSRLTAYILQYGHEGIAFGGEVAGLVNGAMLKAAGGGLWWGSVGTWPW